MRSLGVYLRLTGWSVGLGVGTSLLIIYSGGQGADLPVTAACAVLMWRIVVALGLPLPAREERARSTDAVTQEAPLPQGL